MVDMLMDEANYLDDIFHTIDPDENFFNSIFNSLDQPRQSNYYTVDRYNANCRGLASITVLNYNIRSFNSNGDTFIALLDSFSSRPDVLILTETWLDANSAVTCSIEGYEAFHT